MGVARSQTLEDGDPLRWPSMTLHQEHTSAEYVRYEMFIRRPYALHDFDRRLVIRLSQVSTAVTCALERLRVE